MTASSAARARTISRVTVPTGAEFSEMTPSFSGFFFIIQKLSRVIGLVVMRCFHFARATILTHVAGFGKNVVALFGFWMWQGFLLIGSGLVHGLWKNRSFWRGRKFGGVIFHKF
jgi:hypothetical protein